MRYSDWDNRPLRLVETEPLRRRRVSPAARRRQRLRGLCRLIFLIAALFIVAWTTTRAAEATTAAGADRSRSYVVHAGDTLWGIAIENYGNTLDPREVSFEIERRNHLGGADLQEGQCLTLPYLE